MTHVIAPIVLPALWLLVIIVGLPQISETVYTPALPRIADFLNVSESMVEWTLTIYLFGFALGTLWWGKASDRWGRKPMLLAGLALYCLGCLWCYQASTIAALMWGRLLQAFGGSTGSVLGQAICRDAFSGPERGKVFSTIGSALAFSPAIGPVIGGVLAQYYGWSFNFLFLCIVGLLTLVFTMYMLPETLAPENRSSLSFSLLISTAKRMLSDPYVLAHGFLIAACNGIGFSYFAEGSFIMIQLLGLSPWQYGTTFLGMALAGMLGGVVSRYLHGQHSSLWILQQGLKTLIAGCCLLLILVGLGNGLSWAPFVMAGCILGSMMLIMLGISIVIPNTLSLALEHYRQHQGTASALLGFGYYTVISVFTLLMGLLHTGGLWPMPIYFLTIAILSYAVFKKYLEQPIAKINI